ncbi:lipoxygenase homology domain-containing protein 1-like [Salmo trutta]|uniref:lipoxygenase homology domain-containing protein 1-like n=1 Tax=Salmo trutta TaxID=8032 RepID=UPI0011307119|nr:lipoxygenase homology domain-containing protein 1-like [Salmo trutta]
MCSASQTSSSWESSPRSTCGPTTRSWHLEYINVIDETMDQNFRFPCDHWLAKHVDDGPIMRELACANNEILDFSDKTNEITSDPDVG